MASPLFQEALLAYLGSNPRMYLPGCIKTARLQCGVHGQACLRHRLPPAIGPLLPFCGTSGSLSCTREQGYWERPEMAAKLRMGEPTPAPGGRPSV